MFNKIILALVIIGAINWGLIGIVDIDLVASLLGNMTLASRIIYSIIGLSGIYSVSILFKRITSQTE